MRKISIQLALALIASTGVLQAADTVPAKPVPAAEPRVTVSLERIINDVVRRNSMVKSDYVQSRISGEILKGEQSLYDPALQSSLISQSSKLQNTTEEILTRNTSIFDETLNTIDFGITGLMPTGGQWDVKLAGNQRNNTTIDRYRSFKYEYSNALKLSVTQPLLKGFGRDVTEAKVNLATIQQAVDHGKFEQRLMELIGTTIQVYWKLYGTRQVYESWLDSIRISEHSVKDMEKLVALGKLPATDLMEARNSLIQRRTELYAAQSRVMETQAQLFTLMNRDYSMHIPLQLIISEKGKPVAGLPHDAAHFLASALNRSPEYQNARRAVEKERLQADYARNQARPQLDLIGSVGTNSLDRTFEGSYEYLADERFLSWSVGLKFSIPLFEGQAKSNLEMAKLRLRQAEIELQGLERNLANSIYSKYDSVISLQNQLKELEQGLEIRHKLLEIERVKLEKGRVSQKSLLAQEEEYVNFLRKYLTTLIGLKTAEAGLEIVSGDILPKYGIDPSVYATDGLSVPEDDPAFFQEQS